MTVVLVSSIGGGIGAIALGTPSVGTIVTGVLGALIGWVAWAVLTSVIGTRLLPEPQTRADVGELLRTVGFGAAPGMLRAFAAVPGIGQVVYALASLWMLAATVVAVRQALDYRSTGRAIGVCVVGWLLAFAIAGLFGTAFGPAVS